MQYLYQLPMSLQAGLTLHKHIFYLPSFSHCATTAKLVKDTYKYKVDTIVTKSRSISV